MSIKYMDRVWATKELKHGRLLLMLALADHANDAGECWPSDKHLEEKTRLTDRQLRRVIAALASDGYLVVGQKIVNRRRRTMYYLLPDATQKADILSESKRTKCPKKADKMSEGNGQNVHGKADIFDAVQSRARSEPPIEPTTIEPTTESSSSSMDEDEKPTDPIAAAWLEHYQDKPMPDNGRKVLNRLAANHGIDAVVHAIRAGAAAKASNIEYIAKCARNYIPPAPATNGHGATYRVEIPAAPAPPPQLPAPPPTSTAEPWAQTLADFREIKWLEGSRLVEAADVAGIPLYHIQVCDPASVGWLTNRLGGQLRRSLSITMGKRVLIEIVAAEMEVVS